MGKIKCMKYMKLIILMLLVIVSANKIYCREITFFLYEKDIKVILVDSYDVVTNERCFYFKLENNTNKTFLYVDYDNQFKAYLYPRVDSSGIILGFGNIASLSGPSYETEYYLKSLKPGEIITTSKQRFNVVSKLDMQISFEFCLVKQKRTLRKIKKGNFLLNDYFTKAKRYSMSENW